MCTDSTIPNVASSRSVQALRRHVKVYASCEYLSRYAYKISVYIHAGPNRASLNDIAPKRP